MKYSGHRKLLCCLQIPPRENWFQYVRRVYETAIIFPYIAALDLQKFSRSAYKDFEIRKFPRCIQRGRPHLRKFNHYKIRCLLIFGHSILFRFIDGEEFSCISSSLCCIQFCIIKYTAWMRKHNCISYFHISNILFKIHNFL